MNGTAHWPSVQSIPKLAEKNYLNFNTTDQWTVVEKNTSQRTFLAAEDNNNNGNNKPEVSCRNCGMKGPCMIAKSNKLSKRSLKQGRNSEKLKRNKRETHCTEEQKQH